VALASLCGLDAVRVELACVPSNVAHQLLDMPSVLGKAHVISVKQSATCAQCQREQSTELRQEFFSGPAGKGSAELFCKHCAAPMALGGETARFRGLPWAPIDEIAQAYLAMGPTASDSSSQRYAMLLPAKTPGSGPVSTQTSAAVPANRYEILKTLGSGGMGTVYLGRSVRPGGFERLVAIKQMHPHLARRTESMLMFLDEARLAARIYHPNVVATLDVVRDKDSVLLVMEYVDGLPLSQLLDNGFQPPLPIALRMLLDALSGLHAAHEAHDDEGGPLNIVHRDVSAKNLLIGIDGVTRIVDFGIALAAHRHAATTEPGFIKGTLGYLAPEQARGERVDRRADIFGMGLVAYEAFFQRDDARSMLDAYRCGEELAARLANPGLSDLERKLVEACVPAVQLVREKRYPTALAFLQVLEALRPMLGTPLASAREVGAFVENARRHMPTIADSSLFAS
jgi:hypothetical protein